MFLVDESDTFAKLFLVLDIGRLGNSVGSFVLRRFHQDWELELLGPADALPARDDDEIRHMEMVIVAESFWRCLCVCKRHAAGAATGEREPLHFVKGDNVLVESGVVPELLDQIEENVGLECR